MENEKKIWLIERCVQKIWTVSLTLRQEAARAGEDGRDYAFVANEVRLLADKMHEYAGRLKFGGVDEDGFKELADYSLMLKFLHVNAYLTTIQGVTRSMEFNLPKVMAVYSDDLRTIAYEIEDLVDTCLKQKPFVVPELAEPLEKGGWADYLLYTVGGHHLIVNAYDITEVFYRSQKDINETTLSVRGKDIPIINGYEKLNLPRPDDDFQPVLIFGRKKRFAVPIDDLNIGMIFYTRSGFSVKAKPEHAFQGFAKDCWDLTGGEQVIFADWKRLNK
ncbi:MAG: hypothetical protein FWD90_02735 [Defluviitaleaceae bacterium]|nr:hypothetical protein [Defluviitaleaceae bacterium]